MCFIELHQMCIEMINQLTNSASGTSNWPACAVAAGTFKSQLTITQRIIHLLHQWLVFSGTRLVTANAGFPFTVNNAAGCITAGDVW
jgi:hypothetical protein